MLILAVWRITSAVNREQIGSMFRYRLAGERPDPIVPNAYRYADTFLSHMLMCFWCLSFWVAAGCYIIYLINPLFLYPFAISSLVIALDERVMKLWLGLT